VPYRVGGARSKSAGSDPADLPMVFIPCSGTPYGRRHSFSRPSRRSTGARAARLCSRSSAVRGSPSARSWISRGSAARSCSHRRPRWSARDHSAGALCRPSSDTCPTNALSSTQAGRQEYLRPTFVPVSASDTVPAAAFDARSGLDRRACFRRNDPSRDDACNRQCSTPACRRWAGRRTPTE